MEVDFACPSCPCFEPLSSTNEHPSSSTHHIMLLPPSLREHYLPLAASQHDLSVGHVLFTDIHTTSTSQLFALNNDMPSSMLFDNLLSTLDVSQHPTAMSRNCFRYDSIRTMSAIGNCIRSQIGSNSVSYHSTWSNNSGCISLHCFTTTVQLYHYGRRRDGNYDI